MYLIYLDESGNTGKKLDDPQQPVHSISGLIIEESKIEDIDKDFQHLYNGFLPYSSDARFEFHAMDIVGGKKWFKNYSIHERLRLIKALVDLVIKYNLDFVTASIEKSKLQKSSEVIIHPHRIAFKKLVGKIDVYLDKKKSKGLVIMDRNQPMEQVIVNDFVGFKSTSFPTGTNFGHLSKTETIVQNLVDTVYYTDSHNSNCMQLADVVGYIRHVAAMCVYGYNDELKLNYVKKEVYNQFTHLYDRWIDIKD